MCNLIRIPVDNIGCIIACDAVYFSRCFVQGYFVCLVNGMLEYIILLVLIPYLHLHRHIIYSVQDYNIWDPTGSWWKFQISIVTWRGLGLMHGPSIEPLSCQFWGIYRYWSIHFAWQLGYISCYRCYTDGYTEIHILSISRHNVCHWCRLWGTLIDK